MTTRLTELAISTTGNITGNVVRTDNYQYANGQPFTGGGVSTYGNANVDAHLAGTAGNIIPVGNNVQSLGNATNQWADLWVSNNTIYINSVPITLGAGNVLTVDGNAVLSNDSDTSITTTGNITADYFIGDGSQLTNLPSGGGLPIANGTSNFDIATANGTPTITSNGNTWTFGNVDVPDGLYWPDGSFQATAFVGSAQYLTNPGCVSVTTNSTGNTAYTWIFGTNGTTVFPTLTVARGDQTGTLTGQTLLFGDSAQEALISTPNGVANVTPNSQRLVINPGAGADGTTGEGGDIYLYAGRGGDAGGSGGDIKIRGGLGPVAGNGGYITMEGGEADVDGDGGYIEIYGGQSGNSTGGYLDLRGGYGRTGGDANVSGGFGATGPGGDVSIIGGGSANGQAEYGNVIVATGSKNWTFDNTGNLVLPSGTPSINYANGDPFSGTPVNTGNVTFDDNIVIGTGDEFGFSGLYLAIGAASAANLQYFRVRGGDNPTHLHFDTGNSAYYDQYFGDDGKFVKLEAGDFGNVSIGTQDLGNSYAWTFGNDGNLTIPAGGAIETAPGSAGNILLHPDDNGQVIIQGNNGGGSLLTVRSDASDAQNRVEVDTFGTSNALGGTFTGRFARGTFSSPQAVQGQDILAAFKGKGHDGTSYTSPTGQITIDAATNWTPTNLGTHISFYTTPVNSNVMQESARLYAVGDYHQIIGSIIVEAGNISANGNVIANNIGNISAVNLDGNASTVLYGNGVFSVLPSGSGYGDSNVSNLLASFGSNTISTTGNVSVGNISATYVYGDTLEGNIFVATTANISGNLSATGNITGNYILGNGSQLTSLPAPAVAQDITSNGAMSIMTYDGNIKYVSYATVEPSSGNITGGNILTGGLVSATGNVTGNYFIGNGSQLTGISASLPLANGTSNIDIATANGNVTITANAETYTFGTNSTLTLPGGSRLRPLGANLDIFAGTGSYVNLITSDESSRMGVDNSGGFITTAGGTWQFDTTGNLTAPGNVSAVGNITGGNLITTGNIVLTGNLVGTGASPAPSINGFNIINSVTVSATGNISGNYFIGNGSQLTGISSGVQSSIVNGTSNVDIATANDNITLTSAGSYTWSFKTDGNLRVPANSAIETAPGSGGNILFHPDDGGSVIVQGNTGAGSLFSVRSDASNSQNRIEIDTFGTSNALGGTFTGRFARGTSLGSLQAVQGQDMLAAFKGKGYDGTSYTNPTAQVTIDAATNWTPTNLGTHIGFYTTPVNSNVMQESSRILAVGDYNQLIGNIIVTAGNISANGNVSGNYFIGNGSQLTGTVAWVTAPIANTSTGTAGQVAYDVGGNLYVCVSANTWSKFTGTTSW
jgi:hypothetical protein